MRAIAKLLFGDEGARLLDLLTFDDEERRMADRAGRSGEWCGSTPGRDAAARQASGRRRGGRRTGPVRREIIIRELP